FELAPIFGETNLANDQNLLIMSIMKRVARKHGFRVLLHEKPFAGINGSGKHNNWSLGTDTGVGLFTPGKTPEENLQFVTFIVNILMAVYKNNALLKASVMTAMNAHRLGANEAPPAIISVFLGTQLSSLLDKIENSTSEDGITLDDKKKMQLGIGSIPEVLIDNTDRNRTSPFAFTGNRFEFRAVGSSANCASAMIAVNTAVAAQLTEFKSTVDAKIAAGQSKEHAIFEVIKQYIKESKAIRFDGNGYSDEWKAEAAKRGLDCETSVPKIYDAYTKPESIAMFEKLGVFTSKELAARNEVKWDIYTKKIQIEARVLGDLVLSSIVPVATKYQALLLDSANKMVKVFGEDKASKLGAQTLKTIEKISEYIDSLKTNVEAMVDARRKANRIESEQEKAIAYHDTVLPFFDVIRDNVDNLELIVDDEMWPLPKYRELLFIR
ncbi:MAG: glutamine synthetase type III, partial [Bacteroidales bacterium]|nr:glutamine synthetase type III [Bacteroidales bacterium]